jgi:hypothetical protein
MSYSYNTDLAIFVKKNFGYRIERNLKCQEKINLCVKSHNLMAWIRIKKSWLFLIELFQNIKRGFVFQGF